MTKSNGTAEKVKDETSEPTAEEQFLELKGKMVQEFQVELQALLAKYKPYGISLEAQISIKTD